MTRQVSIAEIMVDLMPRLERQAQSPSTVFKDFTPRLWQDCLDVLRWMTQPYPPSKYSRAEFLELRDAMHEGLAVDGEFLGVHRFTEQRDAAGTDLGLQESKFAIMLLDALTTAALDATIQNTIIEKCAKLFETNDRWNEPAIAEHIRSLKIPSAGG